MPEARNTAENTLLGVAGSHDKESGHVLVVGQFNWPETC